MESRARLFGHPIHQMLVVLPLGVLDPATIAILLSAATAALAGLTGWLGGELVDRLGVGVDDGAHLNAPSSLHGPIPRA